MRTAMWVSNSYGMAYELCYVISFLLVMFMSDGFYLCFFICIGGGLYLYGGCLMGDFECCVFVLDVLMTANAMDGNYRGFRYAFDVLCFYVNMFYLIDLRYDLKDVVVFKFKFLIFFDY